MNSQEDPKKSNKTSYFRAKIKLDNPNVGQVFETTDKDLAAEQGITVEQLRDARAKVLARVYALILSWPDPTSR